MNGSRTAIAGGRLVTESAVFDATILVDDAGSVSGLVAPSGSVEAEETIDASGLLIFAGGVDSHTHFNDPGLTASEDFSTGTAGAAAGGYTTVLEMPQTQPLVDSVETFRHKLETVAPKAVVDFGLYGALVPGNAGDLDALRATADAGAIALKGFVCDTPEMPTLTEADLGTGFRNAREVELPVAVHCESQPVMDRATEELRRTGAPDAYAVAGSHPLEAEQEAVRMALAVAGENRGALHLVHMSDPSTVQLATQAKLAGVDVSVETCPHYLSLTRDVLRETGGWGLCFPPLRTSEAVDGLWSALAAGLIDNVGSDHCAYTLDQKVTHDPWEILPGINGVQVSLPVLVHEAMRRGVPLPAVARAFSAGPARRFSLAPRKGTIAPGSDADLVFVDPESSFTVRAAELFTRCPGTVYDGMTFDARVRRTMVRGRTVYLDDGAPTIAVDPGFGRFLEGNVMRDQRLSAVG